MSNPVSRYITNVFNAGEKLAGAVGQPNLFGSSRKDNPKEQAAARGQAWGALLQNRTYDEQGIIKKSASLSQKGHLGGTHAGGHSDIGQSLKGKK